MISQVQAARLMAAHEKAVEAHLNHTIVCLRPEMKSKMTMAERFHQTFDARLAAETAFQELLSTLIDENDR